MELLLDLSALRYGFKWEKPEPWRKNNEAEAAGQAGKNFLDHMMSLENPFPEEANTISDPSISSSATGLGEGFEEERPGWFGRRDSISLSEGQHLSITQFYHR